MDNDLISVTVISENATEADIFAKTLLIMGKDQGVEYSSNNNLASLLVAKNQDIHVSSEMRKYLYYEAN